MEFILRYILENSVVSHMGSPILENSDVTLGPLFIYFFFLLGLHLEHIEVPGLRAAVASLHHSHSSTRPELHLQPMLQLATTLDP